MQTREKYTPEQVELIKSLSDGTLTVNEITKTFGEKTGVKLTEDTIRHFIKRNGLRFKRAGHVFKREGWSFTDEEVAALHPLCDGSLTIPQIQRKMMDAGFKGWEAYAKVRDYIGRTAGTSFKKVQSVCDENADTIREIFKEKRTLDNALLLLKKKGVNISKGQLMSWLTKNNLRWQKLNTSAITQSVTRIAAKRSLYTKEPVKEYIPEGRGKHIDDIKRGDCMTPMWRIGEAITHMHCGKPLYKAAWCKTCYDRYYTIAKKIDDK